MVGIAFASTKLITVTLDGKPFTKKGAVINGQLYVPASDVAKAFSLDLKYDAANSAATFTTSGGQEAATGAEGKTDEWLFNGHTRVKLSSATSTIARGTVYLLEVRNADKKTKVFNFGFSETQLLLLDADENQVPGALVDRDKDYSVWVQSATPYRAKFVFKTPEGFAAKRMVIRLQTQISGNQPVQEVFRVTL